MLEFGCIVPQPGFYVVYVLHGACHWSWRVRALYYSKKIIQGYCICLGQGDRDSTKKLKKILRYLMSAAKMHREKGK